MKMSEDQQKCFESWLRANCSNLKCALCQSVRWKIGDLLPPAHINPLEQDLGAHEPVMAQLVCKNCAIWCCSMSAASKAGTTMASRTVRRR